MNLRIAELNFGGFLVRRVRYTPSFVVDRHEHDWPRLNFVVTGSMEEKSGPKTAQAQTFAIAVKPSGIEHENCYGPHGTDLMTLSFDPQFISSCGVTTLFERYRWLHDCLDACFVVRLLEGLNPYQRSTCKAVEQQIPILLSTLCRTVANASAPSWVAQSRTHVNRTCRLTDIASAAGVHRVTLAKRFRQHYGYSPRELRRWRRVQFAAHLIGVGMQGSLSQIAFQSDFADQSHMCRDFRKTLGTSPMRYRELATG